MAFVKTCYVAPTESDPEYYYSTMGAFVSLATASRIRCTNKDDWYGRTYEHGALIWTAFETDIWNGPLEDLHFVLNGMLDEERKCKAPECVFVNDATDAPTCGIMDHLFPLYTFIMNHEIDKPGGTSVPCWFVVHPDERARMERILAGTDNPIHDLVHELRYNPRLALGAEVAEARDDFNGKKRTRK